MTKYRLWVKMEKVWMWKHLHKYPGCSYVVNQTNHAKCEKQVLWLQMFKKKSVLQILQKFHPGSETTCLPVAPLCKVPR